jgi:hypothetical protein
MPGKERKEQVEQSCSLGGLIQTDKQTNKQTAPTLPDLAVKNKERE